MFNKIQHINDVLTFISEKKEIRVQQQADGLTVVCYEAYDEQTFDTAAALECRGIVFDRTGALVSRPLHKFFNLGEFPAYSLEKLMARDDIACIFEKIDGSMVATAWVDDKLLWRSMKSFSSPVVSYTETFLAKSENQRLQQFAQLAASQGMTAVFELQHPDLPIVIPPDKVDLRLLHVRDNLSGEYLMLNPQHPVHDWIAEYAIPLAPRFDAWTLRMALEALPEMADSEGFVIQFQNGDMLKVKCPWYLRRHGASSVLRERDVAILALEQKLDDVKAALAQAGVDLTEVLVTEARLHQQLRLLEQEIAALAAQGAGLDRKGFALKFRPHPLFSLAMAHFTGQKPQLTPWYGANRLKQDFGMRVVAEFPETASPDN